MTDAKCLLSNIKNWCTRHRESITWVLRVLVGATFIFSGFSKVVDPWGFTYKIEDYLTAWDFMDFSTETIVAFAVILSTMEFLIGLLLALGCLRAFSARVAFLFMCVMLPLTAYVWIANPVADCGCFGEALIISNATTFWKNVVLMVMIVWLLYNNNKVAGVYPHIFQWIIVMAAVVYCLILAFLGYMVQPVYDFRPYKTGTSLIDYDDDASDISMIYEKDGEEREFALDQLPDSTWTYVGRVEKEGNDGNHHFAVFDDTGEVTEEVISDEGPQLLLLVSNPEAHRRARASMENRMHTYVEEDGGSMIGIVSIHPDSLEAWKQYSNPDFDVYVADDTQIKELARGEAAVVYLKDGIIQWKRNLYTLPADFPDFEAEENELDSVTAVDTGSLLLKLTGALLAVLLLLLFSRTTKLK